MHEALSAQVHAPLHFPNLPCLTAIAADGETVLFFPLEVCRIEYAPLFPPMPQALPGTEGGGVSRSEGGGGWGAGGLLGEWGPGDKMGGWGEVEKVVRAVASVEERDDWDEEEREMIGMKEKEDDWDDEERKMIGMKEREDDSDDEKVVASVKERDDWDNENARRSLGDISMWQGGELAVAGGGGTLESRWQSMIYWYPSTSTDSAGTKVEILTFWGGGGRLRAGCKVSAS